MSDQLVRLDRLTPTSLSTLKDCPLKLKLRMARKGTGGAALRISSVSQGLGLIAHNAMKEFVDQGGIGRPDPSAAMEAAWETAVNEAVHALDGQGSQLGHPDSWPKYHLRREQLALVCEDLIRVVSRLGPDPELLTEVSLNDGGAYWGIADLVGRGRGSSIVVDYKSGAVTDQEGLVRSDYETQIQIYAYLAFSTFGTWPDSGWILSFDGSSYEVDVEPSECLAAVAVGSGLLDDFNSGLNGQSATPSYMSCRFCDWLPSCDSYWSVSESLAEEGLVAVRGELRGLSHTRLGGYALEVDSVDQPIDGVVTIRRILPSDVPVVEGLSIGDKVCLVPVYDASADDQDFHDYRLGVGGRLAVL